MSMMIVIFKIERAQTRSKWLQCPVESEMLQRGLAQCVRKTWIVDCTSQHQGADHRRDGDECALVCAGLSPVGRLAGDEVDHLLDVARGDATHFGRLAWHLRAERGQGAADLNLLRRAPSRDRR